LSRYQFDVGETVMTMSGPYEEHGSPVKIVSRWFGTLYVVRLPNGELRWLDDTEINPIDPSRRQLRAGDIAIVFSNRHQHSFVKKGDLVEVVKVFKNTDYYKVSMNGDNHWYPGFELAKHI